MSIFFALNSNIEENQFFSIGLEVFTRSIGFLSGTILLMALFLPIETDQNRELLMIACCIAIITTAAATLFKRHFGHTFGFWTCAIMFFVLSVTIHFEDNQVLNGVYFILPLVLLASFATFSQIVLLSVLCALSWRINVAIYPIENGTISDNPISTLIVVFLSIVIFSLGAQYRHRLYLRELDNAEMANQKFKFLFNQSTNPKIIFKNGKIFESNLAFKNLMAQMFQANGNGVSTTHNPLHSNFINQLTEAHDTAHGYPLTGLDGNQESYSFWVTVLDYIWEDESYFLAQLTNLKQVEAYMQMVEESQQRHSLAENKIKEDQIRLQLVKEQATHLSDLNRKISQQYNDLEKINGEKDELIRIVAHDLKSPLSGIKLTVDMLLRGIDNVTQEKLIRKLGLIQKSVNQVINIVDRILVKDVFESGKIEPIFIKINISELIANTIESYQSQADSKRIRFNLGPGCRSNMTVHSDREVLQQVINNIVSNAIKYSPADKMVTFTVMETEKFIGLAITDQGLGLTKEDKQKLFSKYSKLSARPTGGEKSTGLGLYITKRLMETLKGNITAESSGQNMGSTFTIFIPKPPSYSEVHDTASRLKLPIR